MKLNRVVGSWRLILPLVALALVSPQRASAQPTMDSLWPNDDGHSWLYEQVYHDWYAGEVIENEVRLFFNGADTVPGGIVVQNLDVEILGAPLAPTSGSTDQGVKLLSGDTDVPAAADPFMRTLWKARPDLREAIREKLDAGPAEPVRYPPGFYQLLLGEAAYRKSDEDIAAYRRDIEATKSWLWLVQDLTIGNTFEFQLVPDLADDVWLYGTLAAWEDIDVPAGHFAGCLRVDYRIDYGASICTDETGSELGGFSSETRGFVHFAPEVGPVNHGEEFIPFKEFLWGECPEWEIYQGVVFTSGSLRLMGEQPTAVKPTTWGRLRTLYRNP
jgi:hypothetical protein